MPLPTMTPHAQPELEEISRLGHELGAIVATLGVDQMHPAGWTFRDRVKVNPIGEPLNPFARSFNPNTCEPAQPAPEGGIVISLTMPGARKLKKLLTTVIVNALEDEYGD